MHFCTKEFANQKALQCTWCLGHVHSSRLPSPIVHTLRACSDVVNRAIEQETPWEQVDLYITRDVGLQLSLLPIFTKTSRVQLVRPRATSRPQNSGAEDGALYCSFTIAALLLSMPCLRTLPHRKRAPRVPRVAIMFLVRCVKRGFSVTNVPSPEPKKMFRQSLHCAKFPQDTCRSEGPHHTRDVAAVHWYGSVFLELTSSSPIFLHARTNSVLQLYAFPTTVEDHFERDSSDEAEDDRRNATCGLVACRYATGRKFRFRRTVGELTSM